MGTDIGAGALPTDSAPLIYRNALSVVIDGVDYTGHVTETETGGPLVLDLGDLDGLAPTQTFVLYITYTVGISEASLARSQSRPSTTGPSSTCPIRNPATSAPGTTPSIRLSS